MTWLTGLGGGVLGTLLGCLLTLWAANQWPSFDDRLLIFAGLMPLFGFMAGFVPVARMRGEWPPLVRGPRILMGFACGVLCAIGMYLAFLMVSYTWNKGTLPPEKQSIVYLMFHPADIPPVGKLEKNRAGQQQVQREETWHVMTIICFFVGGFIGYAWSRGGA
jgi:hypothetical protein